MLAGPRARAAETQDGVIPESDVTIESIKQVFRGAYLDSEPLPDKPNVLRFTDGGVYVFITVDPEKKVVNFFSVWRIKENASPAQKLQLVNRWNDKLLLVRFSLTNDTGLWCDYQLPYEGGLKASQVLATYRIFLRVIEGAALTQDPDDLIQSTAPAAANGRPNGGRAVTAVARDRRV
jgi:hypothetical protein